MKSGSKEIEIKLLVGDVAGLRRRLRQLGFRVRQPRGLEENVIYDTPAGSLRKRGALLRIRTFRGCHTLTYKERAGESKRYKIRREVETPLADGVTVRKILAALGYQPAFRYEKYRTVYHAPRNWRGGEVMLDETPIGNYLELEGNPAWIRRLAGRLGAEPREFITKDYGALYAEWCRRRGRKMTDMIFRRHPRRSS
jgi:adenylate cyclase class 2